MMNLVGVQFGEYRLVEKLGGGGCGDVYLGEHQRDHTQAAVKILHRPLTGKEALKDFINEARTIRLNHPHIIHLLDFGVGENDLPFLVMEFAPHGTLRTQHPKGSILSASTVIHYVLPIAQALQYAHDQHLVHRDVKPENMLLNAHNDVLVSDFGISTIAQSTSSSNLQESVAGTVLYMAPEQFNGQPRPASDQYALAVMVYEWLCGRLPFQGTTVEVAMQHQHASPPSLRQHNPLISADVERVVMIALSKDPKQRFASIHAFATALKVASQLPPASPSSSPFLQNGAANQLLPNSIPTVLPHNAQTPANGAETVPSPPMPSFPSTPPTFAQISGTVEIRDGRKKHQKSLTIALILLALLLILGTMIYTIPGGMALLTPRTINTPIPHTTSTTASTPVPPLPYPPANWHQVLSDPLSKPDHWQNGSNTNFGSSCQFNNGALHLTQTQGGTYFCPTPTLSYKDFTFEVKATITKGECAGMTFRGSTSSTYYFEICQGGQYYLILYFPDSSTTLISDSSAAIQTTLNQPNLIAVVAIGNHIELYINHALVHSIDDSTGSSGAINLGVSTDGPLTDAAFTDAKVWTP
jgi:serine/threonine protein kinase